MLKKTLSIFAPLALLLTMSVPLTSPAAAFRDVCMRFPTGIGYAGVFRVEYGNPHVLRSAVFINSRESGYPLEIDTWESIGYLAKVRGRVGWSPKIRVWGYKCLSMDGVRDGEHFAVLLKADGGWGSLSYLRYCRGWGGWEAREPLIFRHDATDRSRLMLVARGTVWDMECRAEWAR